MIELIMTAVLVASCKFLHFRDPTRGLAAH